jgi:hypothetical protein
MIVLELKTDLWLVVVLQVDHGRWTIDHDYGGFETDPWSAVDGPWSIYIPAPDNQSAVGGQNVALSPKQRYFF